MQPPSKEVHKVFWVFIVVSKFYHWGGLRSYKRGGLPIEVGLYSKCILPEKVVSQKRWFLMVGFLKRGTTVQLEKNPPQWAVVTKISALKIYVVDF